MKPVALEPGRALGDVEMSKHTLSRRDLGLAAAAAVLLSVSGLAAASLTVIPRGVIYTITTDGNLLWMRHDGRSDGSRRWAAKTGSKVGVGWTHTPVFSGSNGVIYVIAANGDLLWYRHEGRADGTFKWASNTGRKVGTGWGGAQHVFSGSDGVIYAIAANGDLLWYRHDGRGDGSFKWASNTGRIVGRGWGGLQHVFSGGNGVIYAVAANGDLLWNRHEGRADGTFKWAASTGRKVGSGWGGMKRVFSGGDDGIIYVVRADGELLWYRHEGIGDGTFRWTSNTGRPIGSGWASPTYVFGG
jgi:hypothetical protein